MLMQTIRASRPHLARVTRQYAATSRRTILAPTAIRLADIVQEMYLRELRNYKLPQPKPSDAEGHVQKFTMPRTPPSPEEGDIAKDLKAYEEQQVEVEGQAAGGGSGTAAEHDWFEEEEEEPTSSTSH